MKPKAKAGLCVARGENIYLISRELNSNALQYQSYRFNKRQMRKEEIYFKTQQTWLGRLIWRSMLFIEYRHKILFSLLINDWCC